MPGTQELCDKCLRNSIPFCALLGNFVFLLFTTKKSVFVFSDEDITFGGNLFAFSLGEGGGRNNELRLNDSTKYFFYNCIRALSMYRAWEGEGYQPSNVPTHRMDFT